jgi:lambda family phage portal protein
MDFITKAISFISPGMASERVRNQLKLQIMDSEVRKYEGAGNGRRFGNWGNSSQSQNQQITTSVDKLRERARDMVRNNGYAKNAIRRIGNNVVGTGILATPVLKNKDQEKNIKEIFIAWADSTDCDFDQQQNFYGIQKMVIKTVAKSGACFVRRVWKKGRYKDKTIRLELQVLEPEFLDRTKTGVYMDNGEYTFHGIQYDKNGKRKAYWIFDRHPNDFKAESKPVPVSDIKHVFDVEDPGQVDGIPFMASVLLSMRDFDEFLDATLIKQKVASANAAFITREQESVPGVKSKNADLFDRIEPGMIQELNPGESVTFSNPPTTEGISDYARQSHRGHAAGIGLSYEQYTGDLTGVNFSSGRMGWIESRLNFEDLQWNMMVPMFLNPVWDWFIQAAYLSGATTERKVPVTWTPPRREMIDPVKETKALSELVRNGFASWSSAIRQLGYNPDEVMEELKKDAKDFDTAKLMPESDPRFDAARMGKVKKEQTPTD